MRLPTRYLAAAALAALAACGEPAQTNNAATLPADPEARDSVKASLTTPAPDVTSTSADSTAARSTVTPR